MLKPADWLNLAHFACSPHHFNHSLHMLLHFSELYSPFFLSLHLGLILFLASWTPLLPAESLTTVHVFADPLSASESLERPSYLLQWVDFGVPSRDVLASEK